MDDRPRGIMSVVVTLFLLAPAAALLTSPNALIHKPGGWNRGRPFGLTHPSLARISRHLLVRQDET